MTKKLFFVFAIIAIGFFASCKKDYTCSCISTITNTAMVPPETLTATATSIIHDTKGNATSKCASQSTTSSFLFLSTKVECKIQ